MLEVLIFFLVSLVLCKFSGSVSLGWGIVLDKLTFFLLLLLFWLTLVLLFLAKKYEIGYNKVEIFKKTLLVLRYFLFLSLSLKDLLGFYVFFEISLVPLVALLVG